MEYLFRLIIPDCSSSINGSNDLYMEKIVEPMYEVEGELFRCFGNKVIPLEAKATLPDEKLSFESQEECIRRFELFYFSMSNFLGAKIVNKLDLGPSLVALEFSYDDLIIPNVLGNRMHMKGMGWEFKSFDGSKIVKIL